MTRDHTFAQHLADVGAITPEQVATHASRHVLTNFVGGPSQGVEPEIDVVMLSDGDRILLCSDGLTDMVEDAEVTEILGGTPTRWMPRVSWSIGRWSTAVAIT